MNSTTIPTTLLYFSPSPAASTESSSKRQAHNPRHVQLKLDKRQNGWNFLSKSIKCTQNRGIRNPTALASCLAATEAPPSKAAELVTDKRKRLVLEFRSLAEPIDRVKRLLHYAARLPPYNESTRKPESRVPGCSTQVWVEAEMDELGRMRFRADSDSEISKGFCSCLIWMLDGAEAAEVLEVKTRDLEDVNVGVYGKVNSRVNTWHNVLLAMQRKTQALVAEREGKRPLEALPSLLASTNEVAEFLHICGLAKATSSLMELSDKEAVTARFRREENSTAPQQVLGKHKARRVPLVLEFSKDCIHDDEAQPFFPSFCLAMDF